MHTFPRPAKTRFPNAALLVAFCAAIFAYGAPLFAQSSVREVKVVGNHGAVEIEVEASDRIIPQSQVLTGPDRLVVDFPNSVPGTALRNQSVNLGQVKDVRFGLYQSKPPVTRLVLDLKSAQSYQIFPYGRTVMIKVLGTAPDASDGVVAASPQPATQPGLVNTNYATGAERIQPNAKPSIAPRPATTARAQSAKGQSAFMQSAPTQAAPPKSSLEVTFRNGLLAIKANKATFSEVLYAVQQRTGAEIAIPAGAEQERVVADIGPGAPQEVLASLLNGSSFNFLILNSASNPNQLDRVILTPRAGGGVVVASGPVSAPAAEPEETASDEVYHYEAPPPPADPRPPQAVAAVPNAETRGPNPIEDVSDNQ
jgi:hypothetical protein